jgi:hypothetical protein
LISLFSSAFCRGGFSDFFALTPIFALKFVRFPQNLPQFADFLKNSYRNLSIANFKIEIKELLSDYFFQYF